MIRNILIILISILNIVFESRKYNQLQQCNIIVTSTLSFFRYITITASAITHKTINTIINVNGLN